MGSYAALEPMPDSADPTAQLGFCFFSVSLVREALSLASCLNFLNGRLWVSLIVRSRPHGSHCCCWLGEKGVQLVERVACDDQD